MTKTNKLSRKQKIVIALIAVFLILVFIPLMVVEHSYFFQVAIMRGSMNESAITYPEAYSDYLDKTTSTNEIQYSNQVKNSYLDLISPKQDGEYPLILYVHGGGFVAGDKGSKTSYCTMLASNGYVVANVNYVLAPDSHYPTQLFQINTALDFLLENADDFSIDKSKIYFAGDSAGAHLALQLALCYTSEALNSSINLPVINNVTEISGVILHCGLYEMEHLKKESVPFMSHAMWIYTNERFFLKYDKIAELDLVRYIDQNTPPIFLTSGDKDPFRPQTERLIQKLDEHKLDYYAYLPSSGKTKLKHEFQANFKNEEAYVALDLLLNWLDRALN